MLEFLQALVVVNLGIIFVLLDVLVLAVVGDFILDRIRPEGQSTSLEEED